MTAEPVSRLFELQIRHIHFVAQIPHLEELKQNDTSFNRTGVTRDTKIYAAICEMYFEVAPGDDVR